MATFNDLAIRTLQKLQVLGQDETASPADLAKAVEKVTAVHALLKAKGVLRWTKTDIPDYAEEPYVLIAAFFGAPDFQVERDPMGLQMGLNMIYEAVNLPAIGVTYAEYF